MFEVEVPGKFVLAGEHSVLKGYPAIALPHPSLRLRLQFQSGSTFSVEPAEVETLIRDVLEQSGVEIPPGRVKVESSIPLGAGLGSSAALCVALTRWLAPRLGIPEDEWADFATRMENRFHGESSGMDISVVMSGEPVSFIRGKGARRLGINALPHFTFHDTGLRASTRDCVAHVEQLRVEKPELGLGLDRIMGEAAMQAQLGLVAFHEGRRIEGLNDIAEAMNIGQKCYLRWGLLPDSVGAQAEKLLNEGALAVKLTGAGNGGFLVALWMDS